MSVLATETSERKYVQCRDGGMDVLPALKTALKLSTAMKALTICQPYADLICLPDSDPRAKRVENRVHWRYDYTGPLLIHAGKSREWLEVDEDVDCDAEYGLPLGSMVFGAIVGIANLDGVTRVIPVFSEGRRVGRRFPDGALTRWPWLGIHLHTEGPVCLVLSDCRRFVEPIAYRGQQGLFDVPRDVVSAAIDQVYVGEAKPV